MKRYWTLLMLLFLFACAKEEREPQILFMNPSYMTEADFRFTGEERFEMKWEKGVLIFIYSNYPWEATIDDSWVTVSPNKSGTGRTTMIFTTHEPNLSDTIRTTLLRITAHGHSFRPIPLFIQPTESIVLSDENFEAVNTTASYEMGANGGDITVYLKSNVSSTLFGWAFDKEDPADQFVTNLGYTMAVTPEISGVRYSYFFGDWYNTVQKFRVEPNTTGQPRTINIRYLKASSCGDIEEIRLKGEAEAAKKMDLELYRSMRKRAKDKATITISQKAK